MTKAIQKLIVRKSPMFYTRNCFDRPSNPPDWIAAPAPLRVELMSPDDRKAFRSRLRTASARLKNHEETSCDSQI